MPKVVTTHIPENVPVVSFEVTGIELRNRFLPEEELAILEFIETPSEDETVKKHARIVAIWFDRLREAGEQKFDLRSESVVKGVYWLLKLELIDPSRPDEILKAQ